MGIWIGDRQSYTSWPYYLPVPFVMTSSTSTKENGSGFAETPAHPVRNSTDNNNGGRTTFSQRIAWRNSNNITVVTPAAMETTTPVTPAATAATSRMRPSGNVNWNRHVMRFTFCKSRMLCTSTISPWRELKNE
jgi:hypothetical protein